MCCFVQVVCVFKCEDGFITGLAAPAAVSSLLSSMWVVEVSCESVEMSIQHDRRKSDESTTPATSRRHLRRAFVHSEGASATAKARGRRAATGRQHAQHPPGGAREKVVEQGANVNVMYVPTQAKRPVPP